MGRSLAYPQQAANTVKRYKHRATYDLDAVHSIVNAAPVLHVSFADPSQPFPVILPMIGQMGDFHRPSAGPDEPLHCYLHGYVSSRIMNTARSAAPDAPADGAPADGDGGLPVSIAATLVDGLVLSLTPNSHNYNYRSAVLHGYARLVERDDEKLFAMQLITDSVVPGRWQNSRVPPDSAEMQSTSILRVQVTGGSGKIRDGGVTDLKKDYSNEQVTRRVWTGVIPVWETKGAPVPSEGNQVHPVPDYVSSYIAACNEQGQSYAREAIQVPLPKEEVH